MLDVEELLNRLARTPEKPYCRILRRSIDARKGVRFQLRVECSATPFQPRSLEPQVEPVDPSAPRVLIVGTGPAGLFAALSVLEGGAIPVLLDRGEGFPERHERSKELRIWGRESGYGAMIHGLGGAGAYSDGKLMTRSKGRTVRKVLNTFSWFADDPSLLLDNHPHVGSDRLPIASDRFRAFLVERGAEFHFNTEVTGLVIRRGRIAGVEVKGKEPVFGDAVIGAMGNSARDLFARLHEQEIQMEPKGFAVGVRVEHPRALIDKIQLGSFAGHPALGAARYAFAMQANGRGVYSFCMCPGGYVIPTPPEPHLLSVNGMSFSSRNSAFSNAAVVATVNPEDWGGTVLGGIDFQRQIEKGAMEAGGGDYVAPAQPLADFVEGLPGACRRVDNSSYQRGLMAHPLASLFPEAVALSLRQALGQVDDTMRGYYTNEATVIAPETMTSSPVRFPRNSETMSSPSCAGFFPAGEGAGWAGGITSSSVDGYRVGEQAAAFAFKAASAK